MTDNDIKSICGRIESLHEKILKSKFAETVTESEMLSLVFAVRGLNDQKAEIENLEKCLVDQFDSYENIRKKVKAEAIKEFAERLKDVFVTIDGTFECWEVEEHIDSLVKEMTGENNG